MTDRAAALHRAARRAVDAQHHALTLKHAGRLRYVADDPDCPDLLRLAALVEETGEVARCVHDGFKVQLADELAHVAGVALAWLTHLENTTQPEKETP